MENSPQEGKEQRDEKEILRQQFSREYDQCSEKILHLADSLPFITNQAKAFQEASLQLNELICQMKEEIPRIQQEYQNALAPILPLYQLRMKVCPL